MFQAAHKLCRFQQMAVSSPRTTICYELAVDRYWRKPERCEDINGKYNVELEAM